MRWPDPYSRTSIGVEHWNVAERQGQMAVLNILGAQEPFVAAPFCRSQHYDVFINYVRHAEGWDEIDGDGDVSSRGCLPLYKGKARVMAVASIFRDIDGLRAELTMERARW